VLGHKAFLAFGLSLMSIGGHKPDARLSAKSISEALDLASDFSASKGGDQHDSAPTVW